MIALELLDILLFFLPGNTYCMPDLLHTQHSKVSLYILFCTLLCKGLECSRVLTVMTTLTVYIEMAKCCVCKIVLTFLQHCIAYL